MEVEDMPPPPTWLDALLDRVTPAIQGYDYLSPLGCHFHYEEVTRQWEVTVFASLTEIVGGRLDGLRTNSQFAVDLIVVQTAFDTIDQFHWQAQSLGSDDDLGPHVSLEGSFDGHRVWLRILAKAPSGIEPGRSYNTVDQKLEELW